MPVRSIAESSILRTRAVPLVCSVPVHEFTGRTATPSSPRYRKACGSHSASEPESFWNICDRRRGCGRVADVEQGDLGAERAAPCSLASWPTPISRPSPAGCRYAE
ncbi:hypothetical protein GCM10018952_02950 [Streptosporangium vulgare]